MRKTRIAAALVAAVVAVGLFALGGAAAQARGVQPPQDMAELVLDLGNKLTMKLVRIPAGKFTMGSPETEKGRDDDETQHEATISKAFHMGRTHVTVDQFAAFVKDTGYKTDAEKDGWAFTVKIADGAFVVKEADGAPWRKPGFDQKGDHPVVQVSWNDAVAFCDWLSKKSGKPVRLPTEAEWEYACRAGTKTAYPWGDKPDDGKGHANAADQALKKALHNTPDLPDERFFSWDDGFVFTSPAGSFKPNAFGLYDMIGNAWQWCGDWYGDYAKGAQIDPAGPPAGEGRVLRGGSWNDYPRHCRSAYRLWSAPDYRSIDNGIRVVVSGAVGVD